MRKILLASFAANTIEKFIKKIEIQPENKNIAFIPTASNIYQDWKPIDDRQKLIELGFNVKDISLEGKTKEQLYFELEEVDLIFVAGGNTFYLL
ncbi:MAG: putative peptidase dipeptidase, partial [Herbinix sp.]|nr:putative peptidase dipeptidase [Herbinix sp.]